MKGLARLIAVIALLALSAEAAARERVVTLPPAPQPTEIALSGGRLAWVERSARGDVQVDRVRIAAPGEAPRDLAVFEAAGRGQPFFQLVTIEASETHVAATRIVVEVRPLGGRSNASEDEVLADEVWAGPADGQLARLAACQPGSGRPWLAYNFDVSAGRVVHETCGGGRELAVHDLATGGERTIVRGGSHAGRRLSLAGRYLAWEERDQAGHERTLVVHDLEAGSDARRIAQPRGELLRTDAFYVQEDGKLLDPRFGFDVPIVYTLAADDPGRILRHMSATRFANDSTLEVHRYGQRADLTVNAIDGTRIPVTRADAYRISGRTDFDGQRVAWGETRCGATTLWIQTAGDPFSVSGSTLEGRCARVALPRSATPSRSGAFRLPLRCVEMRRCAGRLKLSLADGTRVLSRTFDFGRRARGTVLARLPAGVRRVRADVYDRDGFVLARRDLALRP